MSGWTMLLAGAMHAAMPSGATALFKGIGAIIMYRKLAIAALVAATSMSALAQTPPAKPAPSAGQRKYNSIFPVNTPKRVLEPLKAEEGIWDADVELYVGPIDQQPIRKKGVQTNRLVSRGHAIVNDFRYTDGSYEGTGMWGWDAYHNRYSGTWIDGDTHLVRQDVGYYDPDTQTFRWEADTLQPDGVTTRMRITQRFMGDRRRFQIDVMDAKSGIFNKLIVMSFVRRAATTAAPAAPAKQAALATVK